MPDGDLSSAIQMISMMGQAIGVMVRISSTTTRAVTSALGAAHKAVSEYQNTGKQSFRNLNRNASRSGQALEDIKVEDANCKEIARELKRNGVDFSIVKDHTGQKHIFVKAPNTATLNMALEKVLASKLKRSTPQKAAADQEQKPRANMARSDLAESEVPEAAASSDPSLPATLAQSAPPKKNAPQWKRFSEHMAEAKVKADAINARRKSQAPGRDVRGHGKEGPVREL